jgi:hypothetical protein
MPPHPDAGRGDGTMFLRACLRLPYDPGAAASLRARARDFDGDWQSLLVLSRSERVAPLLHRAVRGRGIVPRAVARAWRRSRHSTALHNMLLLRELEPCLQQFAAARVPVIVLKGAALTTAVYRDLTLRPMADIDLLVRQEDRAATRRILEKRGYTAARAETHPGALFEYENEFLFAKSGTVKVWLDVHWSLVDSPHYQARIGMDWFWATAQPFAIADTPTSMLGPEALLMHLCGHLALHHRLKGLLWWHDIAEVIECYRGRIDWVQLLCRTRQYGLALPVYTVLRIVGEEWSAPIPPDVLGALRADRSSRQERRIFTWLTAAERPVGQRFWTDIVSLPHWGQRWRFARTQLLPSVAYMRQRYRIRHALLVPLYYPYRWLQGLRGLRTGSP